MFNKQGFVLTMKKKGLQQHNFTIYLTERAQHLLFLLSGVYTVSEINRNYITLRSNLCTWNGSEIFRMLEGPCGPSLLLLCFYLTSIQLFKKPSCVTSVFQKTGLFKEHTMIVSSDAHVSVWLVCSLTTPCSSPKEF